MMFTRFFRNASLQQKQTLLMMATAAAALVLATGGFLAQESWMFRDSLRRLLATRAGVIGHVSTAALEFDDPKVAGEVVNSLQADAAMVAGALYRRSGQRFVQFQRPGAAAPPQVVDGAGERLSGNRIAVWRPVLSDGETVGFIYLESDLSSLRAHERKLLLISAGLLVVSLGAAFVLASRFQRMLSRPVLQLLATARVVAEQKDFSLRARKESDDELGRLVDGFNEMLQQIQSRDGELQRHRDELEHRVAERTRDLRASEQRIRLIVDCAFDAIVTADAAGTIIEWNGQAEKTFGWSRVEAMGRNFVGTIFPPRFREAHRQELERFVETGEAQVLNKRLELAALHKDGHEFAVDLAISPVRLGESVIFSAFLRDISERKATEAKLAELNNRLLETSRHAGMAEVATSVLHNVGNVLNSVNVSSGLLNELTRKLPVADLERVVALLHEQGDQLGAFFTSDPRGPKVRDFLARLTDRFTHQQERQLAELASLARNVEHIKEIVAMQQSYARVSGVNESLQVVDLIEDALRMNAGSLERHEVKVVRELAPDLPAVTTDKHKALQILVNLMRNAKYACDESGRADKVVTVRARHGDGRVWIEVIDNGVGIPAENLTRIFNHGFTTRKDGHGFGLHSGANAAKELGGALTARSDGPGRGATFTLELPVQRARTGGQTSLPQAA